MYLTGLYEILAVNTSILCAYIHAYICIYIYIDKCFNHKNNQSPARHQSSHCLRMLLKSKYPISMAYLLCEVCCSQDMLTNYINPNTSVLQIPLFAFALYFLVLSNIICLHYLLSIKFSQPLLSVLTLRVLINKIDDVVPKCR